jgi:hypothetical protein
MKIGILTFHFSDNYGALLQAYGLRRWFLENGQDADFVNYCPEYVESGGAFSEIWNPRKLRANLKVAYLIGTKIKNDIFGSKISKNAFESFRSSELGVVGDSYEDLISLNKANLDFDILVCGSDQIWNPSEQFGVDPVYFLDFTATSKRKISYAASFGSSELKPQFIQDVSRLLRGLDAISVREEGGVNLVNRLTNLDAKCVVDPTFLLADYSHLAPPQCEFDKPYIFSYILRSGVGFKEIAEVLKSDLKADFISANNPHRRWKKIGTEVYGGPIEWLSRLTGSCMVLTNSFHATVFSILQNRPFIAVRLPGAKAKLSGRLENLLEKVGLSDRIIDAGDTSSARRLAASKIDWDAVNARVAALREDGRSFLREQIAKVSQ